MKITDSREMASTKVQGEERSLYDLPEHIQELMNDTFTPEAGAHSTTSSTTETSLHIQELLNETSTSEAGAHLTTNKIEPSQHNPELPNDTSKSETRAHPTTDKTETPDQIQELLKDTSTSEAQAHPTIDKNETIDHIQELLEDTPTFKMIAEPTSDKIESFSKISEGNATNHLEDKTTLPIINVDSPSVANHEEKILESDRSNMDSELIEDAITNKSCDEPSGSLLNERNINEPNLSINETPRVKSVEVVHPPLDLTKPITMWTFHSNNGSILTERPNSDIVLLKNARDACGDPLNLSKSSTPPHLKSKIDSSLIFEWKYLKSKLFL